jgi:integral membrane protein
MTKEASVKRLFLSGHIEGISYLLLLFVAMPLKYMADMPKAVSIAGGIHGVLFVWFIYEIFEALASKKITLAKSFLAFFASLIPFATFFLEKIILGRKAD